MSLYCANIFIEREAIFTDTLQLDTDMLQGCHGSVMDGYGLFEGGVYWLQNDGKMVKKYSAKDDMRMQYLFFS